MTTELDRLLGSRVGSTERGEVMPTGLWEWIFACILGVAVFAVVVQAVIAGLFIGRGI